MRVQASVLLTLASLMLVAPPATAKEVAEAQVCGAARCAAIEGDDQQLEAVATAGNPTDPPARGPWYSIRITIAPVKGEGFKAFTFRNAYVPGSGRLRIRAEGGGYQWVEATPEMRAIVRRTVRGLAPYPGAKLRGLDVRMPHARVDEVVLPPRPEPPARDGGGTPWGWIVVFGAGAGAAAALGQRTRRRRAGPAAAAPTS